MKKSLLIGVATVALIGVSATLFAQTATGSSVIAEMKAATRSFTLKADLNSGSTANLQSSPVTGKETGDMLTAGEWNRVLELVAQGGGGGGFEINDSTTKTTYRLSYDPVNGWSSPSVVITCPASVANPTECRALDTAAHDFCHVVSSAGSAPHASMSYLGAKKYRLSNNRYANLDPYSSGITVQCYDGISGGTGGGVGGGLSWVNVPLTDTGDFDMTCAYRATLNIANDTISRTWHGSDVIVIYPDGVGPKYLSFLKQDASYFGIRNTNKNVYGSRNGSTGVYTPSTTVTVTKIEKDC